MDRFEILLTLWITVLVTATAWLGIVMMLCHESRKARQCKNMVKGKEYHILVLSDDTCYWMVIKGKDDEFPFTVALTLKQLTGLKIGDIVQWNGISLTKFRLLSDEDIAQMDAFMR